MEYPKNYAKRLLSLFISPFRKQIPITDEEKFYSPNNSLEDIHTTLIATGDSILVDKSEYDTLIEKLDICEKEKQMYKAKEAEYKNLLVDFDTTLSFIMEKDSILKLDDERDNEVIQLQMKVAKLEKSEERLLEMVNSLRNDLMMSEEKVEAFRQIAGEKIEALTRENERLKMLYEMEKDVVRKLGQDRVSVGQNLENVERMLRDVTFDDCKS